ncbi:hypothetical protein LY78DRAFT_102876 [Colletotrichum sublineola]|nr:hypothetical protein LY78DRAFT_102876 [Colletotrichum sublineola]
MYQKKEAALLERTQPIPAPTRHLGVAWAAYLVRHQTNDTNKFFLFRSHKRLHNHSPALLICMFAPLNGLLCNSQRALFSLSLAQAVTCPLHCASPRPPPAQFIPDEPDLGGQLLQFSFFVDAFFFFFSFRVSLHPSGIFTTPFAALHVAREPPYPPHLQPSPCV